MKKIFLLTVSLLFAFTTIYAERVSQEDAALVANHFMSATVQTGVKKASGSKMVLKKAASAEENQYYVYENASGEGWVMVAANDIAHPILAYSPTGQFRTDNQPKNLKVWLGGYDRQIKRAAADGVEASESIQQEWASLRKSPVVKTATPVVSPLIKTGWDQDAPFWNLCPSKSGSQCYTQGNISYTGRNCRVGGLAGGISTAAAQIRQCTFAGSIEATRVIHDEPAEKYFAVGGLIGVYTGGSGNTLIQVDSKTCSFTGSVTCTNKAQSVGIIVGWVSGSSAINFGSSDGPIQATGTFARAGLSEITINTGNVDTYAIGNKENASANIYVTSTTPAPANLTLMSFNIREGSNWNDRKSPIVSMINGEAPDIIGLQEVKDVDVFDLAKIGGKQPWAYLTDNLGSYTGYRYSDKTNAILYKTSTVEMSDFGHFWLRDSYSSEGDSWDGYERTVLYATVREKATGRYFFYLTTHFPMNNSNDGWAKCTSLLESRIAALNTNDYPVILMGDFNCVIGNACWDSIKTWMKNTRYSATSIVSTDNQNLYTYNAFGDSSKDRNKVDHIWVSKSITVDSYVTLTNAVRSYGGYTTNGETFLSDHYPVIAHIS